MNISTPKQSIIPFFEGSDQLLAGHQLVLTETPLSGSINNLQSGVYILSFAEATGFYAGYVVFHIAENGVGTQSYGINTSGGFVTIPGTPTTDVRLFQPTSISWSLLNSTASSQLVNYTIIKIN